MVKALNDDITQYSNKIHDLINDDFKQHGSKINAFSSYVFSMLNTSEMRDEIIECDYFSELDDETIKLNGYALVEGGTELSLFVCDYFDQLQNTTLNPDIIKKRLRGLIYFIEMSQENISTNFDPGHPIDDLNHELYDTKHDLQLINIYVVTNGLIQDKKFEDYNINHPNTIAYNYKFYDLEDLMRIEATLGQIEKSVNIDFQEFNINPTALQEKFHSPRLKYRSFTFNLPANIIAQLYHIHGTTILDSNVRAYLQATGRVNKGIKFTITDHPEIFFAYNNGLSVIARDIEIEEFDSHCVIKKITDFSIINGGQTSATLNTLFANNENELSKAKVQVKLTIIDDAKDKENYITNISRYANTQNPIRNSDLASSHPYFINLEKISEKISIPNSEDNKHWYFERMRGSYKEKKRKLTSSQQKLFTKSFPLNKKFGKTDLAKYINSFEHLPYLVSKGAENNFTAFENHTMVSYHINESNYPTVIAKAIIFRETEKLLKENKSKFPAHRNIITNYAVSTLSYFHENIISFDKIWENQEIDQILKNQLFKIAQLVNTHIRNPPNNQNIGEYAKSKLCWETFIDNYDKSLVEKTTVKDTKKESYKKNLDTNLEIPKTPHSEENFTINKILLIINPVDTKMQIETTNRQVKSYEIYNDSHFDFIRKNQRNSQFEHILNEVKKELNRRNNTNNSFIFDFTEDLQIQIRLKRNNFETSFQQFAIYPDSHIEEFDQIIFFEKITVEKDKNQYILICEENNNYHKIFVKNHVYDDEFEQNILNPSRHKLLNLITKILIENSTPQKSYGYHGNDIEIQLNFDSQLDIVHNKQSHINTNFSYYTSGKLLIAHYFDTVIEYQINIICEVYKFILHKYQKDDLVKITDVFRSLRYLNDKITQNNYKDVNVTIDIMENQKFIEYSNDTPRLIADKKQIEDYFKSLLNCS